MEIYKQLFALQNEIGKISKTETNPFFKSKYFDINQLLEQLKPLLEKHQLLVNQPIAITEGRMILRTVISYIEGKVGDRNSTLDTALCSEMILPDLTDPQKLGSVITYYRRYALQSLLLLQAEDDDGNKASYQKPATQSAPQLDSTSARKKCSTCFQEFNPKPGFEWATKCFDCWKKEKDENVGSTTTATKTPVAATPEASEPSWDDVPFG